MHANPVEKSFGAALHAATVESLSRRGHEIDDCDLYAQSFDPVLSREDRLSYGEPTLNRRNVEPYVTRLLAAEALLAVICNSRSPETAPKVGSGCRRNGRDDCGPDGGSARDEDD